MGLIGAGMSACLGCLIGADKENLRIKEGTSAIENGQLLILVDLPKARVDDFKALVKQHYPEARFKATEPTVPNFPY